MNIRNASYDDINELLKIYLYAKQIQCETGNPTQWLNGYPQRELIEKDILNKIMQKLLDKNGFEYCGQITVEDGSPRKAYQRVK